MENHREHREHSGTQRWQKRKITTLCDPLCPLWFNLPYHDQILWKGEKVCALANYRESQNLLVLTFSVVGSSNPPSRCSNHGCHSFVFVSLHLCDFLVKSEERERREAQWRKGWKPQNPSESENLKLTFAAIAHGRPKVTLFACLFSEQVS